MDRKLARRALAGLTSRHGLNRVGSLLPEERRRELSITIAIEPAEEPAEEPKKGELEDE